MLAYAAVHHSLNGTLGAVETLEWDSLWSQSRFSYMQVSRPWTMYFTSLSPCPIYKEGRKAGRRKIKKKGSGTSQGPAEKQREEEIGIK